MKSPYEDIIRLSRPVSKNHKPMSLQDRAAQFSPFAALTGYDAAVAETARLTQTALELDVDAQADLNEKLLFLQRRISQGPRITVTHFVPDAYKAGGAYVTTTGILRKLDSLGKWLLLEDGTRIFFGDIASLDSPIFPSLSKEIGQIPTDDIENTR